MREARNGLQGELECIHAKGDTLKARKAVHEQALVDAKKNQMRLLNLQKGDKVDGQKEGHGEEPYSSEVALDSPVLDTSALAVDESFSNIASDDKETGVALGKTDTLRDMRDTGFAMLENINKQLRRWA